MALLKRKRGGSSVRGRPSFEEDHPGVERQIITFGLRVTEWEHTKKTNRTAWLEQAARMQIEEEKQTGYVRWAKKGAPIQPLPTAERGIRPGPLPIYEEPQQSVTFYLDKEIVRYMNNCGYVYARWLNVAARKLRKRQQGNTEQETDSATILA